MKYKGTLTIYDLDGTPVFGRDMTADEMMDEVLTMATVARIDPGDIEMREPPVKEEVRELPPPAKKERKPYTRKMAGCDTCGSKGMRHKLGCALAGKGSRDEVGKPQVRKSAELPPDFDEDGEPLTEDQFDEVKEMKEDNKPSLVIASHLKCKLIEVNKAFSAPDFDYYIEHR